MAKVEEPEQTVKFTSPFGSIVEVGKSAEGIYLTAGYRPVATRSPAKKTVK